MYTLEIEAREIVVPGSLAATRLRKQLNIFVASDIYWVRKYRDGKIWIGPNFSSEKTFNILKEVLTKLQFKFKCEGKKGTVGEYIIELEKY